MATVLVLGVGGILGEAWMWGYLGGAHRATGEDFRKAKQLIGTSAGSIVAARLAGGEDPRRGEERIAWDGELEPERRPGALWAALERASRISLGAFSPLAAPTLSAATPGGALARAAVLARVPPGPTISTAAPRLRAAAASTEVERRQPAASPRSAMPGEVPIAAVGTRQSTRSPRPARARSRFVGLQTPPSTYSRPPISIGAK